MKTLRIEKTGAVACVSLTGAKLGGAAVSEMRSAFEALREDADVRAIILSGADECFSGGWDWGALSGEPPQDTLDNLRAAGVLDDPFGCIAESPKPVIAAVGGDATGGGLALVLAADIRVASDTGRFALSEVEAGLLPMAGVTQRLVRLVGRGNAMQMVLTGEAVDAHEALRIGLVSEVVPAGGVLARAMEIAERIAEGGALAVQLAKEAVSRGVEMPLEQALRYETDLTVILQTTEDRAEGVRAFLEKRKADFKGR